MGSSDTIVFPESGAVRIEEREIDLPDDGEVLIDTDRTLVSTGTELTVLSGEHPPESAWDSEAEMAVEAKFSQYEFRERDRTDESEL